MPYTLNFSDPTKQTTITVPDMPPGINSVDTSLNLVGRAYPNYGQKFAENFLHLLENFASPVPPANPIEGQLWFDTSDPAHKVLRIMDGTASAVRWPSANGIYQQSSDPNTEYAVKNGDIWVDTNSNNLKIWNGLSWQIVGPNSNTSDSLLTGSVVETVSAINGSSYPVIKNYVNGDVISIISGFTTATFTPLSVIQGFLQIKPGINMSSMTVNNQSAQIYGTAQNAYNLNINGINYGSSDFLRKSDTTPTGQEITGKIVFRTTSTTGSLGRDGVVILPQGKTTEYVQLYKNSNDAVLLNNTVGGKIQLQVNPTGNVTDLFTSVSIDPVSGATISTSTSIQIQGNPTLDVGVSGSYPFITAWTTASFIKDVVVTGDIYNLGKITSGDDITVEGQLYLNWNNGEAGPAILPGTSSVPQDNVFDIGSPTANFRRIYAKQIGTAGITQFYGTLTGSATKLDKPIQLAVQGQVTASIVTIQGDGVGSTVNMSLTNYAVANQTSITTATSTATMLVLNNGQLAQISKNNFLQDIAVTGMITIWTSSTPPTGWLLCDGTAKSIITYANLFSVISYNYGNSGAVFNVPSLLLQDLNAKPLYYIIKY
jgi:hypothetical protein